MNTDTLIAVTGHESRFCGTSYRDQAHSRHTLSMGGGGGIMDLSHLAPFLIEAESTDHMHT